MEGERTMTMKKYTRFLAGVLIMAICVTTWLPVSFAAEKGATVTSTESLVASIGRTMQVSYKMDGSTIIEVTRFTDVDGQNVIMNRSVKKDGTGELVYTKAQKVQKVSLANQDYDVFLKLATSKSAPQTRSATVGSDVTGSQYKHVFVSNLSYTIDNSAIAQIEIGGVEAAASLLIAKFALPGGTAVTIGSFAYSVITAFSPSKMVIKQSLYEIHFTYDNSYYTHCYHDTMYSYDSGGHLVDTQITYYQAVGG